MKHYKLQELVGQTKKLPRIESLFYETLINFRKLPECAQLFLPLQLHTHVKLKRNHNSLQASNSNHSQDENHFKQQCSQEEEEVQSYLEWKTFISWIRLSSLKQFRRLRKSVIYLLPIGPFPENLLTSLVSPHLTFFQSLTNFGEAFFPGVTFKVLPEIEYSEIGCRTRIHSRTGNLQLLLPDVMQYLSKVAPKNCIGIIGLSWIDFFPGDEWNHILGEGSVYNGCAAISFGHHALFVAENASSIVSSQGRNLSESRCLSNSPTEQIDITPSSSRCHEKQYLSKSYKVKRFPKLNEISRRRATSYNDISRPNSTSHSNVSINIPMTSSSNSYKRFSSLASLNKSWTEIFSDANKKSHSSTSSFEVDDASYDIINHDEVAMFPTSHGLEKDVVKIALPVGCSFKLSCHTMWRLFKALSHETGHIFGLSHCNFYECAMNSSSFVSEVDEQPLFLCPICLRKLQKFLKFRLVDRYQRLWDVLTTMNPCYHEDISVSRRSFDVLSEDSDEIRTSSNNTGLCTSSPFTNFNDIQDEDTSRHICIEVTREKNEGYDIVNVEYKRSQADRYAILEHECRFTEAMEKLEGIIQFLKRH